MAECRTTPEIDKGTDLTSLSNVLNLILGAFRLMQQPAQTIPPPLVLVGKNSRPGMSSRNLAARSIARMESDAGIPMGDVFSDGDNAIPMLVRIISDEFVTMLQTEASVTVAMDPGAVQVTASGSAGPIPVVVQGSNTLFFSGGGGLT